MVRAFVDDLRGSGPTLIVVEDAHWADEATVEVLAMLGRRAVDLSLLLLVTYRDGEVTVDHPLRVVLGDLATSSGAAWIALRPLSPQAVRVLAEPAGAASDELYELTGGNPFYVTEVLSDPTTTVPTTVRLAVLARASRLPDPARAVVDAVSIVPGRAEPWLIEAMCGSSADAVDACIARGVLVGEQGTYAFRHEVARLAVEAELGEGQRRVLHRRGAAADRPCRRRSGEDRSSRRRRRRRRRRGPLREGGLPAGIGSSRAPRGGAPRRTSACVAGLAVA